MKLLGLDVALECECQGDEFLVPEKILSSNAGEAQAARSQAQDRTTMYVTPDAADESVAFY